MRNKLLGIMTCMFLSSCTLQMPVFAAGESQIVVSDEYVNSTSDIRVTTDKDVESIRVKLDYGPYKDITESRSFNVTKNCTAYVKIKYTDDDGNTKVEEISKEIENFDGESPKLNAYIKGEELYIASDDDVSGTKVINVDGTDFYESDMGINLKELENSKEELSVYVIDNAGNKSEVKKVNNPYYVGEKPQSNEDKGVNNPQSTEASKPISSVAVIDEHTDEDGDNLTNITYEQWQETNGDGGGKQFFTIKTKSDKTFYLVVDETDYQKEAYLLTEVGENDLLNFVNYDGNRVESGETNLYMLENSKQSAVETPVEVVQATEKSESKPKSPVIIIILAIGAVAIIYFVKFKNNGGSDEDEEDSEFDEELQNQSLESEIYTES